MLLYFVILLNNIIGFLVVWRFNWILYKKNVINLMKLNDIDTKINKLNDIDTKINELSKIIPKNYWKYFQYHNDLSISSPKLNKKKNKNKTIPYIIYKTNKCNRDQLGNQVTDIFKKTMNNNINFKIKYYSDYDCESFIKKYFDDSVLETFRNLIPGAYKADLFRYCVLYIKGGIYSDLTQQFLIPITDFVDLENDNLVIVRDRGCGDNFPYRGVQIAFIAAIPNLPIFKDVIYNIVDNYKNNFYGKTQYDVTGPYLFRKWLDYYVINENISYRLELEQIDDNYISFIKNGKKAIITHHKNHWDFVEKTNDFNYHKLWYQKEIYKKIKKK